jgi:hypothetical protein
MKKIKIYVGCALTHAPEEYKQSIYALKEHLRNLSGVEILDFVTPLNGEKQTSMDSAEVYNNDIHSCVANANLFIAEITHPSTGLGWELGTAVEKHRTQTIMCAQKDVLVSRLPLGSAVMNEHATVHRYEKSIMELVPLFEKIINVHLKK